MEGPQGQAKKEGPERPGTTVYARQNIPCDERPHRSVRKSRRTAQPDASVVNVVHKTLSIASTKLASRTG